MTKQVSRLGTEDFGVESNDAAMVGDSPTKSVGARRLQPNFLS